MLINNGQISKEVTPIISPNNSALTHGHSIIEEMRIMGGQIMFWEAHYLKIMASMRMLRISIPMDFTPEFLSDIILSALSESVELNQDALVSFQVYPDALNFMETQYHIHLSALANNSWETSNIGAFEMGLYKDYYLSNNGLSSLPTNNQLISSLASVFAYENDFQACFLINMDKEVAGTNCGSLYMLLDQEIHTAPLSAGAKDSILRKKMNEAIEKDSTYALKTVSISPFSLQKADALCILNISDGVISVTKYRKKAYQGEGFTSFMRQLLLNMTQDSLV